jgi:DNA-directed RNA polymerase specialized sigma24 family protein
MTLHESITDLLGRLKVGDRAAAQDLWEAYCWRLVGLARKKLRGAPRRAADEEDVALCAFDSFCRGAERGRFPQLRDREELWQVLIVLTARKASNQVRRERRHKRGGGKVRGDSALAGPGQEAAGFDQLAGTAPAPAFAAEVADEVRRLLAGLGDAGLRSLALLKMEGFTNKQIAARLDCAESTVERRLALIRKRWRREAVP